MTIIKQEQNKQKNNMTGKMQYTISTRATTLNLKKHK
jgi:hypothetical protein